MIYQFKGLQTKAGRAEGFRSGVLQGHEAEIANFLYPEDGLQERSLSFLTFLASLGGELLDALDREIKIGTGDHCIVRLPPPV